MPVLLISFPIAEAILVNSDLLPSPLPWLCNSRCLASARGGSDDLLRMDSTHARNSFVLSCMGIAVALKHASITNLTGRWSETENERERDTVKNKDMCLSENKSDFTARNVDGGGARRALSQSGNSARGARKNLAQRG